MDLEKAGASVAGNRQYREWVKSLKAKIRRAQAKAAVRVNVELLRLYWGMGRDIAEKRMEAEYGSGFFDNLSRDLKNEFPDKEGFSVSHLKYIKRFYLLYASLDRGRWNEANRQQPVDELDAIGLLICKRKKRLVAEYALKSSAQLLGVSEYKLTKLLPQDFKSSLPSVKDIEAQLAEKNRAEQKHKGRSKVRHAKRAAAAARQIADAKKGNGK